MGSGAVHQSTPLTSTHPAIRPPRGGVTARRVLFCLGYERTALPTFGGPPVPGAISWDAERNLHRVAPEGGLRRLVISDRPTDVEAVPGLDLPTELRHAG